MILCRNVGGFGAARDAVGAIYGLFASSYREGAFHPFSGPMFAGQQCLEFKTRYFSRANQVEQATVDIDNTLDPFGILRKVLHTKRLCHTSENHVVYRKRIIEIDEDGPYVLFYCWLPIPTVDHSLILVQLYEI